MDPAKQHTSFETSLTTNEEKVVKALAEAWNKFVSLPEMHPDDVHEFRFAIHIAQRIVLSRPGRRQIAAHGIAGGTKGVDRDV